MERAKKLRRLKNVAADNGSVRPCAVLRGAHRLGSLRRAAILGSGYERLHVSVMRFEHGGMRFVNSRLPWRIWRQWLLAETAISAGLVAEYADCRLSSQLAVSSGICRIAAISCTSHLLLHYKPNAPLVVLCSFPAIPQNKARRRRSVGLGVKTRMVSTTTASLPF